MTLPVNLTGKEVYVSVAMTDGTKNVTIPVKVDVKELKANAVNTITVANVSLADNRFAWYQPEETRYLAEGWAYGEANTFVTSADGGRSRSMSGRAASSTAAKSRNTPKSSSPTTSREPTTRWRSTASGTTLTPRPTMPRRWRSEATAN